MSIWDIIISLIRSKRRYSLQEIGSKTRIYISGTPLNLQIRHIRTSFWIHHDQKRTGLNLWSHTKLKSKTLFINQLKSQCFQNLQMVWSIKMCLWHIIIKQIQVKIGLQTLSRKELYKSVSGLVRSFMKAKRTLKKEKKRWIECIQEVLRNLMHVQVTKVFRQKIDRKLWKRRRLKNMN